MSPNAAGRRIAHVALPLLALLAACGQMQPPQGNERASLAFFEARLAAHPDDIIAPAELADRYLSSFGRHREIDDVWKAENALRRGLEAHPGYGPFLSRLTSVHIARHEFPEALAAARAAYAANPRRALNGPLFDAFFETGQYDSAGAALERMDADAFSYLIRKSRFAAALGQPSTARRALERACRPDGLTQDELHAWCAVRTADLAAVTADAKRARRILRRALSSRPDEPALIMALAVTLIGDGDLAQAARLLGRIASTPMSAEAHLWLARIAVRHGDSLLAEAHRAAFDRVATDPRYGRAFWSLRAEMLAESGRFGEAVELARRDLAQRPGPETFGTLASVLFRAGELDEAGDALARALTWTPFDAGLLALQDSMATSPRARRASAMPAPGVRRESGSASRSSSASKAAIFSARVAGG